MSEPHFAHGKICYLMVPSRDPRESARFYQSVFNWSVRERGDGSLTFDDAVGQVSGTWMTDREPADNPGTVIHIMVRNAADVERAIVEHGGTLVWKAGPEEPEVYGTFRDPDGNLFGYYQERTLA